MIVPTFMMTLALQPVDAASRQFLAASSGSLPSFDEFISRHGRTYTEGSAEYVLRRSIYETRLQKIESHNARPDRLWTAGVNHLSDSTEAEFRARLGWRHIGRSQRGSSLLEVEKTRDEDMVSYKPPEVMNWKNLTMASIPAPDQGECGSCWAVASAQVLSAHFEITHGKAVSFSAQELVSCVKNPLKCGGSGGCDGATVELAMDWVLYNGLKTEDDLPYQGSQTECERAPFRATAEEQGKLDADGRLVTFVEPNEVFFEGNAASRTSAISSFRTLEKNRYLPLVRALVEYGPVGVTVAAEQWDQYASGVFDGCGEDRTLNHAVVLMGIGKLHNKKTWIIRNSWGNGWGEKGYMNLLRTDNEEDNCGIDKKPKEGVGCIGGPSAVRVCGTCGILYDSVIPTFDPKQHSLTEKRHGHSHKPLHGFVGKRHSHKHKRSLVRGERQ